LINASFIAFFISILYSSIIVAIDHFYGSDKSTEIVHVILMILNLSFYITFTVLYYIKKTSDPEE
jgi:thiosulfate reductase cytochrome b subunit